MKFITKTLTKKFWEKQSADVIEIVEEEHKTRLEDIEKLLRHTRIDILSGISSHDVTAVRIALRNNDLDHRQTTNPDVITRLSTPEVQSVGLSRRDPQDRFDGEVAYLLALGRALEALGHKLTSRANSLVKHNDDVKIAKLQAKTPAAKKRFNDWKSKVRKQREERIRITQDKAADTIRGIATERTI